MLSSCIAMTQDEMTHAMNKQCASSTRTEQALYAASKLKFPKQQMTVCWVNPEEAAPADLLLVQKYVTKSWDDNIDVDFVWTDEKCGGCEDVRIQISDEIPYAILGAWKRSGMDNLPTMFLNFSFLNAQRSCNMNSTKREQCIRSDAVHEFGHALGFLHEQNRTDTPEWCLNRMDQDGLDGLEGDIQSPKWDADSIMNYCSNAVNASETDIKMAQEIYGVEKDGK